MKILNVRRWLCNSMATIMMFGVAACTQMPSVEGSPAGAQQKSADTALPVVVTKVEPTLEAPAAIPPVDGMATSVAASQGSVAPARAQLSAVEIATGSSITPPGTTRYECVHGMQGAESRVAITFPENSGRICARFPAMGPCQYERAACRAAGGRVIRFDGVEITKEVEHEYDKQVTRFRLNAG